MSIHKSPFAAYSGGKGGVCMEGVYDILLGKQPVGQAVMVRQGLYWHFDCRCSLSGEAIFRITVSCGGKTESLGIPVPKGKDFVLRTRLPVKKLGEGEPSFRVVPKHAPMPEQWVPVSAEEPFAYLTRLQDAYLQVRDGHVGVTFRELH